MDNPTENQENDLENEQALIDIFYKDAYRLNSLLSQINKREKSMKKSRP